MTIGRFLGGVAALIWSPSRDEYLLLRRAAQRDFAGGLWECVTGRVDQGEGFEEALHREVREEVGVSVQLEFFVGTTHFYRGAARPENELLGIVCCCSLADPDAIRLTAEHAEYRWVNGSAADAFLAEAGASGAWLRGVIARAEAIRGLITPDLRQFYRQTSLELG